MLNAFLSERSQDDGHSNVRIEPEAALWEGTRFESGNFEKNDKGRAQDVNGQYGADDGFVQARVAEQSRWCAADFPEKQQWEKNIINKLVRSFQKHIIG